MKIQKFDSLGLEVPLSVPETVEEFDTLAGKPGACLAEAIKNVVYRSVLPNVRDCILHGVEADGDKPEIQGVEELSKVPRKRIPALDKDGKERKDDSGNSIMKFDPDDTEGKYFNRVLATIGKEKTHFQHIADSVGPRMVFDPSETVRQPKAPPKLAQDFIDKATEVLSGGRHEKVLKAIQHDLGETFTPPVLGLTEETKSDDVQKLGRAIRAHVMWRQEQAKKKQLGGY